jgi:hypothetical protein
MNFFRNVLVLASFSALSVTAMAKDSKPQVKLAKVSPNCEVKGKKHHVKDEAACTKKKGKWLEASAMATPPAATAPSADTAMPPAASEPAEAPKK